MLKRSISSLHDDFLSLLADVSSLMIVTYDAVPHPSILDVSKQVQSALINLMFQRRCLRIRRAYDATR